MFGQIPDFTNGFEFLRKLWGNASGLPGGLMPGPQAMTPPMDLDELDKRIHDLKAVESWLQLNTNLLRTTIQGLEVQRATLVALQTFGSALSPEAMQNAMENVARAATAPSAAPPEHASRDEAPVFRSASRPEPAPEPDAPAPDSEAGARPGAAGAHQGNGAAHGEAPPNAGIWWDMLQHQFNQIASSAAAASLAPFGNLAAFGTAPASGAGEAGKGDDGAGKAAGDTGKAKPAAKATGGTAARKPAAKRPAARKSAAKPAGGKAGGKA